MLEAVAMLSASQLERCHDLRPGHHALHLGLDHLPAARQRLSAARAIAKRGRGGRKKINEYTRYATFFLCMFQSWFYIASYVESQGLVAAGFQNAAGGLIWYWKIVTVLTMTAGTVFLMWLGEQIDEFGIGNGISLLIMAGILARMPGAGYQLLQQASLELSGAGTSSASKTSSCWRRCSSPWSPAWCLSRSASGASPCKAPSTSAAAASSAAPSNYMPLKVNQAGVMPIIFASSLLMFPMIILHQPGQRLFDRGLVGQDHSLG